MLIGRFVAGVLVVLCGMQGPLGWGQSPVVAQVQAALPTANGATVRVASGTSIPLTLVSAIKSKSTKVGDAVRAQVAFPVTVGNQLAIPAGTYVEGVVEALTAGDRHHRQPNLRIHFTRLLFANGYTVALDAKNLEARVVAVDADEEVAEDESGAGDGAGVQGSEGFGFVAGQSGPPPLPSVGPSKGAVIGGVLGGAVVVAVLGVVFGRRAARNTDAVLFDSGWQFAMVTQGDLVLDSGKVGQ